MIRSATSFAIALLSVSSSAHSVPTILACLTLPKPSTSTLKCLAMNATRLVLETPVAMQIDLTYSVGCFLGVSVGTVPGRSLGISALGTCAGLTSGTGLGAAFGTGGFAGATGLAGSGFAAGAAGFSS